ncbi:hypothetical protein OHT77_43700 [Streptomyces sp. NBC_00252]|nr:hypothetical protein [Streptomyces sp. NBC_00252]
MPVATVVLPVSQPTLPARPRLTRRIGHRAVLPADRLFLAAGLF